MSTLGKIFIVLNVVAAIVLATLVIAFVNQKMERENVQNDWKKLGQSAATKMDQLRDAVKARNSYYDKLASNYEIDVANKNNVITELRGQLTVAQGDKAKMQGELTTLNSSLTGLNDKYDKLNSSKKELEDSYAKEVAAETDLRKKSDEQMTQILNLRKSLSDTTDKEQRLEVELREATKNSEWMKQHAQATLPETVPVLPTVTLHGVVKDVDNTKKVAEISLGSSDQVVAGMVFEVSRGNKYLGDLKIDKVEENASVGTLATVQDQIRRDDNVTYTVKH